MLNPIDPNHDTDDIPSLEDTHDPVQDTATALPTRCRTGAPVYGFAA